MSGDVVRQWVPYGERIDIPEEIWRVFEDSLGFPGESFWSEVETPRIDEGLQGVIVIKVWYDKEKYERHEEPVLVVPIGYWHDHPSMHGAWYYFFPVYEIHRRLQRALMDAEREKEAEEA
jgi:hypothetical protein